MAVWVFSPGLSQEASLAPSLIWPGRSGLGAGRSPLSTTTEGWGPTGHLGLWGCRGWRVGLRTCSHSHLCSLAPCGLWAA